MKGERRPASRLAVHLDVAVMRSYDTADDTQSKARVPWLPRQREKRLKYAVEMARGNIPAVDDDAMDARYIEHSRDPTFPISALADEPSTVSR